MKKQKRSILDDVKIAAPCSADWNQMSGDDRVRFCKLCSLNVYSLSAMTAAEAERFIQERAASGQRTCINFYRRADGTIITENCPVGLRKIRDAARKLRSKVAALIALALSAVNPARAQPDPRADQFKMGEAVAPPDSSFMQEQPRYAGALVIPRANSLHGMNPQTNAQGNSTSVYVQPPVSLSVKAALLSSARAWRQTMESINSSAIKAVSSASIDTSANERELQKCLQQYASQTRQLSASASGGSPERKTLCAVQAALSLNGEANCLYYLGRASEAVAKYEAALSCIEGANFATKPAISRLISANLCHGQRLKRGPLHKNALAERFRQIQASSSTVVNGVGWLSCDSGQCQFTEPLK